MTQAGGGQKVKFFAKVKIDHTTNKEVGGSWRKLEEVKNSSPDYNQI